MDKVQHIVRQILSLVVRASWLGLAVSFAYGTYCIVGLTPNRTATLTNEFAAGLLGMLSLISAWALFRSIGRDEHVYASLDPSRTSLGTGPLSSHVSLIQLLCCAYTFVGGGLFWCGITLVKTVLNLAGTRTILPDNDPVVVAIAFAFIGALMFVLHIMLVRLSVKFVGGSARLRTIDISLGCGVISSLVCFIVFYLFEFGDFQSQVWGIGLIYASPFVGIGLLLGYVYTFALKLTRKSVL